MWWLPSVLINASGRAGFARVCDSTPRACAHRALTKPQSPCVASRYVPCALRGPSRMEPEGQRGQGHAKPKASRVPSVLCPRARCGPLIPRVFRSPQQAADHPALGTISTHLAHAAQLTAVWSLSFLSMQQQSLGGSLTATCGSSAASSWDASRASRACCTRSGPHAA